MLILYYIFVKNRCQQPEGALNHVYLLYNTKLSNRQKMPGNSVENDSAAGNFQRGELRKDPLPDHSGQREDPFVFCFTRMRISADAAAAAKSTASAAGWFASPVFAPDVAEPLTGAGAAETETAA